MTRLVFLSGWGHGPRALDCLARPCAAALGSASWLGFRFDDSLPTPFEPAAAQTVYVGWSAGAIRALELATRGEDMNALVLISGTARFTSNPTMPCGMPPSRLRALRAALAGPRGLPALETFHRDCAWPSDPGEAECARRARVTAERGTLEMTAGLDMLRDTDLTAACGRLRVPVLLLHGGLDRIVPPQASEWLAQRIPGAKFRLFPEAGHRMPMDETSAIADEVTRFLEGGLHAPA